MSVLEKISSKLRVRRENNYIMVLGKEETQAEELEVLVDLGYIGSSINELEACRILQTNPPDMQPALLNSIVHPSERILSPYRQAEDERLCLLCQ